MTRLLIEHYGPQCPECGSERIKRGTAGSNKCYCFECSAEWTCVPPEEPKEKRKPGNGELRGRA